MSNQCVYIWRKQSHKAMTKEKERTFEWNELFFVQTLSGYVIVCVIVIRITSAYELATTFPNIIQYIN